MLLSNSATVLLVTVSWITIPRANVRSWYYPVVLQDCQATVLSGMCPGGSVCLDTVWESPILCGSVHTKCYFYNSLVYIIHVLLICMHGHAACNRSLFKSYYRYVLFLPFENSSNTTNFFLIPSLYLLQKNRLASKYEKWRSWKTAKFFLQKFVIFNMITDSFLIDV